jgi:hypothetical protein
MLKERRLLLPTPCSYAIASDQPYACKRFPFWP